jgi:predicted HAD superfamily hydrolase
VSFKLKTVDVWDTLLRRLCHPELVKVSIARHLFLCPGISFRRDISDHWELYRERLRAEMRLAEEAQSKGFDNEYTLAEVLGLWMRETIHTDEPETLAAQLVAAEFQMECERTYVDPEIRELLEQHPAQTTLFLSDFYMPSDQLSRILGFHGLSEVVGRGISSCDVLLNKRSGRLFRHVHEALDVQPTEHVHIGDNLHSDVQMPMSLGMTGIHHEPLDEHEKRLHRARLFEDRTKLFDTIAKEIEFRTGRQIECVENCEAQTAIEMGTTAAPLFVGFMLFVAEKAIKDGVEKLFFFSKEGDFFLKVWTALFSSKTLVGHKLPQAELLEVSRVATYGASLETLTVDELKRVWKLYPTHSLNSLLRTLGLQPNTFAEMCASHHLDLSENIDHPWADKRIQALIKDPAFELPVIEKCRDDRHLLCAYLDAKGWSEANCRVGIVDIGWRGTIQDNLALTRPASRIHGYYLGLQKFLNPQPENCRKTAYGPNNNISSEYQELLGPVSPFEMLCGSPHGSVVGYSRNNHGEILPYRDQDPTEKKVYETFVQYFQQGVLRATEVWARYADHHVITSEELREPACRLWEALVETPNESFAEKFASMKQADFFGIGGYVDKGAVPALSDLLCATVSKKRRRDLVLFLRQHQWPAGIASRKDLGWLHRTILALLLQLGAVLKKRRYGIVRKNAASGVKTTG